VKRLSRRTATLGAALLTAVGLSSATTPAQAAGSYNIKVASSAVFVADYCLLTSTSGNGKAACTGNKGGFSNYRMSVVHTPGDRVWMDVNIVGGADRKGIDLQGKHYIRVYGDLGAVHVCGWKNEASYFDNNDGLDLHGTGVCRRFT
jgi:hypothetical protein